MQNFTELVEKHKQTLEKAVNANRTREFHAHWPEAPSGKIYGETANDDGKKNFEAMLNKNFEGLVQEGSGEFAGEEESPYGFPLGVRYPAASADTLVANAEKAQRQWRKLSVDERASILIEALERAAKKFFEIGYATMHTTGQGFIMAFQASGPHAYDRALEAVAMGYAALNDFTPNARWIKPMGKMSVTLDKNYHVVPKGIGVVIGCSTFPLWNNLPGMFADLITGNATIAKSHPKAVLPLAIFIADVQNTLKELGVDPHIIQLAADTSAQPVTMELIRHPKVRLIDYTGSSAFGREIEKIAAAEGKVAFTEKAGVNCVVLESAENMDAVLDNLAFSVSLYSGQMCTAPQNFYIPRNGVKEGDTTISLEEFEQRFAKKIEDLAGNEKMGPGTLGAIQNPKTCERIDEAKKLGLKILLDSKGIGQHGFEKARSCSPLLLEADASKEYHLNEWFGPISFIIPVESFEDAVREISETVRTHGALSAAVYTTDPAKKEFAEEEIISAGAPVAFNFTGPIWINQSAAFSDFHGTGANPAGNATFADLSFVTQRYNIIGSRSAVPATA